VLQLSPLERDLASIASYTGLTARSRSAVPMWTSGQLSVAPSASPQHGEVRPVVEDMNGDSATGYCRCLSAATPSSRVSSASAYLDGATRARPNLTIEASTYVERLLFEGTRCVGVSTLQDGGATRAASTAGHPLGRSGPLASDSSCVPGSDRPSTSSL